MARAPPTERSALLGDRQQPPTWVDRVLGGRSGRVSRRTHMIVRIVVIAVASVTLGSIIAALMRRRGPVEAVVTKVHPQEFDVIVIGGGPAGSVVSRLLSDDPWRRVLLIEAGDASQVEVGGTSRIESEFNTRNLTPFDVPFYWTNVANTPSLHWDYPDVNVAKALGGCGIHNAMLYVRALPSDLKRWNMKRWTWEKAVEIYMSMENYDGPDVSYHGKSGTVRTSVAGFRDSLSEQFVEACEQAGIPRSPDFNAPGGRYGVGYYEFNTRDGIRESAARRFLGPILQEKRENFHLMLDTDVKKVTINDAFTAATGVVVDRGDGELERIRLARGGQVVVTAGAINTPKVLMLSGLGHGDDLNKLGLEVKRHLPRVGMNLQDHPVLAMTYENPMAKEVDLQADLEAYFKATQRNDTNVSSYGLYGSAGISAGAFLIVPGRTIPEIQLTFFPRKSEPHVANSSALNHDPQILITVALLHPQARNRIVLTTDDHRTYTPRVVSEVPDHAAEHLRPDDVWKLAWGVSVVREITAALAKKGVIGEEISPGPDVASSEDVNKWVPSAVFRNSHWVGSAAMGTTLQNGVVDDRLRVFGVHNLRVADASVIPTIPNGNVHSSVLMVASYAAELIKEDMPRAPSSSTAN